MGKGSFIAIVALIVAVAGAIVAFAAYFRRRGCALCDGMDEMIDEGDSDDLDYYATQLDSDDDDMDFSEEDEAEEESACEEPEPKESEQ